MTNGEAIKELKEIADEQFSADRAEAIYMAIKALKRGTMDKAECDGEWINDEFGTRCSVCGVYAYRTKAGIPWVSPHCPICGAKMTPPKGEE